MNKKRAVRRSGSLVIRVIGGFSIHSVRARIDAALSLHCKIGFRCGGAEGMTKQHRYSFGDCLVAVTERSCINSPYPTLFFLHGRYGHSEVWEPVADRLSERFRCYLIDLPGFGRSFSARERGLSLLEHAHLVRNLVFNTVEDGRLAILVGHDVGGAIAQLSSVSLKSRLAGVVLVNSSMLQEPLRAIKTGWFGWSARWRLSRLLAQSVAFNQAIEGLLTDPWSLPTSRATLIRALNAFENSWPGPFERQFWKSEFRSLALPVLLLWGHRDPINPPSLGLKMVRELQEAYFFEREESGHWPNLDAPDWVSTKIQEFAFQVSQQELRSARRSLSR